MITILVWLKEVTIISSIMILIIISFKAIFKNKVDIKITQMLWILLLARLIVPITFSSPVHLDSFVKLPGNSPGTAEINLNEPALQQPSNITEQEVVLPDVDMQAEQPADAYTVVNDEKQGIEEASIFDFFKSIKLTTCLFYLWILGALFVFIKKSISGVKFKSLIKLEDKNRYIEIFGTKVKIVVSKFINTPATFGLINPVVLIPKRLVGKVDEKQLQLIMLHEVTHIKRKDILFNYLWLLAKSIYWFNPLVWFAYTQYAGDIEIACDEMVVKNISEEDRYQYSLSLLEVIKLSKPRIASQIGMGLCEDKSKLRKRVETMLKPTKKLKSVSVFAIAIALVMAAGCFTTACMPADTAETAEMLTKTENETMDNQTISHEDVVFTPVGTKGKAFEIAKNLNITNTDKFIYKEYQEEGRVLPTHWITAKGGANYWVYDFNGEILAISIAEGKDETEASISEIEAKDKALQYIREIYGDVDVNIGSCELLRGTTFSIEGTLYKPSEDSTRSLKMSLNGDGELCSIRAAYDEFYVLGVSDELVNKVCSYSQINDVELSLTDVDDSNDDVIYTIAINGADSPTSGDQIVRISASDLSLMEYTSRLGETGVELTLSDAEIEAHALGFIAEYYPQFSDVKIVSMGKAYSEGWTIAQATGCDGQIYVSVWADGSIQTIKLMDAISSDLPDKYINAVAVGRAKDKLIEYTLTLEEGDDIPCVRIYKDLSEENHVVYEFEHQSAAPSARNYSYIATVTHNLAADRYIVRTYPKFEELDIISEEEAIEKAKQKFAEWEGVGLDSVPEVEYCKMEISSTIYYEVSFSYDNTSYSVTVDADRNSPY